jgi:hypothetical protein
MSVDVRCFRCCPLGSVVVGLPADWGRLAGLADAVHVTARAITDENNPYAHAWEVESTLWFRGAVLIRQPNS